MRDSTVANTLNACDKTIIEIAKRYLSKVIDHVTQINVDELDQPTEASITKRPKRFETSADRVENYSLTHKMHIHAVMSLLDILETGNKDQQLTLEVCVNLAELAVQYFFWSSMEPGTFVIAHT